MESEKYDKLENITKRSRFTDLENKPVVTTEEGERSSIGMGGQEEQTIGIQKNTTG